MGNNMGKLNDILFKQLERMESAEGDGIESEIERSKAVVGLAGKIISNGRLVLDAAKCSMDTAERVSVPTMLLPR